MKIDIFNLLFFRLFKNAEKQRFFKTQPAKMYGYLSRVKIDKKPFE